MNYLIPDDIDQYSLDQVLNPFEAEIWDFLEKYSIPEIPKNLPHISHEEMDRLRYIQARSIYLHQHVYKQKLKNIPCNRAIKDLSATTWAIKRIIKILMNFENSETPEELLIFNQKEKRRLKGLIERIDFLEKKSVINFRKREIIALKWAVTFINEQTLYLNQKAPPGSAIRDSGLFFICNFAFFLIGCQQIYSLYAKYK